MKRDLIAKAMNVLGYIALSFQLLWTISVYIPFVLDAEWLNVFSEPIKYEVEPTVPSEISWLPIVFAALAAVAAIGLGVYALLKAPGIVTTKAEKTTKNMSFRLAQPIGRHQHMSKKRTLTLSRRIQLFLKLGLSAVFFIALLPSLILDTQLPHDVLLVVGVWLLVWPFIWFLLGYAVNTTHQKTPLSK